MLPVPRWRKAGLRTVSNPAVRDEARADGSAGFREENLAYLRQQGFDLRQALSV